MSGIQGPRRLRPSSPGLQKPATSWDNNGFVLAPLPVAPVNETDTVLLPEGLNTLKRVARLTDLNIDGSHLNLDGGFDSRHNRKAIFNAGLIPNIKENPRNRKSPKRGRKRLFDAAIPGFAVTGQTP